ncbi:MAG: carbohydrate-binding protein [Clostridia bacterium]
MELTKNIFFNTDKLFQNTKVKISYTGTFFEDDSEEVFIHYGFGTYWDNLSEIKMEKTELGFQAEIELIESDTFNFCFRNEKNEWDNNNYQNYIFELEPQSTDLIVQDLDSSLDRPNRLRKTYLWSKKIRLAIYKIITYVPKLISGNYRRKINNEE